MNPKISASVGGGLMDPTMLAPGTLKNGEMSIQGLRETASENGVGTGIEDAFWHQIADIEVSRWDKLFPYQFLIVKAHNNTYTPTGHRFTLPIPPESYSITMPFAISTRATLGGIVEEHNGAPFRMISLRGTTGYLPSRGRAESQTRDGFANQVGAVFGGTLQTVGNITADAKAFANSLTGQNPRNPNLHNAGEFEKDSLGDKGSELLQKTSGYYQFRMLQKFFEYYAVVKKTKEGHDLRLAFAVWKDQAVYLVTPQTFEVTKSSGSPFEYLYSIALKAWRRVDLSVTGVPIEIQKSARRDPSVLARILNTISDARRVIQGATSLPGAIIGDIQYAVLEPMRRTALFCKHAMGLGATLADLPMDDGPIAQAWHESVAEYKGLQRDVERSSNAFQDALARTQGDNRRFQKKFPNETVATRQARGRAAGADPGKTPFLEGLDDNFDYLNSIDVSSLKPKPELRKQAQRAQAEARATTPKMFADAAAAARSAGAAISQATGAGDPTYDDTYGLTPRTPTKVAPSAPDWAAIYALNAAAEALDALAADAPSNSGSRDIRVAVMQGLATRSGIAFQTPASKFAIPFPYGASLESLALQYLGDPQRWHEIAALNGLRAPYIDEVGFDLYLISNGVGSQIVVPMSTDLFIGQVVYIWSLGYRRTARTITGLREVGGNIIVDVDGDSDMDSYKVAEAARLSALLPDTVNSQGLIYIPSQEDPGDTSAITKSIPGVDEFDPMIAVGGVDLLLDSDNDLIITSDGDARWSTGLANIIQNTRIELGTRRGTLLHHPGYGLPVSVGASTAEVDAKDVANQIKQMLASNPDFSRVDAVEIKKSGPALDINIAVTVAGTEKTVPISYGVRGNFQTA